MSIPSTPTRRRDAERNRAAIVQAARRLVGVHGLGIGHADIAKAAEVGVGTVYRHFPERRDLVEALFTEHIDVVIRYANRALRSATGWEGLRSFMADHLAMQQSDRGLRELLQHANTHPELARSARQRIAPVVSELVDRAHAEGSLHPSVGVGDFVLVGLMVSGVMDACEPHRPDMWRRALDIALEGLHAARELDGAPPSADLVDLIQGSR
ncbi:MAG: TetR/AcrR family transcriptional regulator [Dermatophilaceae bacterium]